jgi:Protein of unknown function (DUF1153)
MIVFAKLRRDGTPTSEGGGEAFRGEPIPSKLPSPNTKRWTASRKAQVVIAVSHGWLPREEACGRYQLSREELVAWEDAFKTHGNPGLRATQIQQYRCPSEGLLDASRGGRLTRIR